MANHRRPSHHQWRCVCHASPTRSRQVVSSKKESTRDIASIALKTVISEVRPYQIRSDQIGY